VNSLSRRSLLRALAAGAGGAALLPIMSRLTSAGTPSVARFLFVVEGNGYDPITVLDPNTQAAIDATTKAKIDGLRTWYNLYDHTSPIIVPTTQFSQTKALQSIASLGLASETAVLFGLSSQITGGGHTGYHGVLSSSRTVGGSPGGQTIDAYLGALPAVRLQTPYDVVRLGMVQPTNAERLAYYTCATAQGVPAAAIVDPMAAYNVLFGLVGTAAQMTAFGQRKTLLDFATQDVQAAVGAFGGSSDERAKLEAYLASLEQLSARQQRLMAMAPQLPKALINCPSPDALTNPATKTTITNDCMVRLDAQLRLAAAALKGQLTDVAVVTCGTGDDFGNLLYPSAPQISGQTIDYQGEMRHPLQHGAIGGDQGSLQTIWNMTAYELGLVAAVAADLASTPDPVASGSMLDNTVIVYISDNGEQHHSTASEFPVVLIGGKNLGLKTGGRTIVYPGVTTGGANHRQVSNLWNTLGYLSGQQLDTFGAEGPLRVAPGPLSEIMS
jgi:hypothetical protein